MNDGRRKTCIACRLCGVLLAACGAATVTSTAAASVAAIAAGTFTVVTVSVFVVVGAATAFVTTAVLGRGSSSRGCNIGAAGRRLYVFFTGLASIVPRTVAIKNFLTVELMSR